MSFGEEFQLLKYFIELAGHRVARGMLRGVGLQQTASNRTVKDVAVRRRSNRMLAFRNTTHGE